MHVIFIDKNTTMQCTTRHNERASYI